MRRDNPYSVNSRAVIITFAAYLLYVLLYIPAFALFGDTTAVFAVIPVIIAAEMFGLLHGMIAAVLTIGLNLALQNAASGSAPQPLLQSSSLLVSLVLLLAALVVGRLHDIRKRENRDLEKRQSAEAALHESEQQFVRMFDQSPIGAAIVSLDGRIMRSNESMCHILGYSQAELNGRTVADITHPEDMRADEEQFRNLLAGEIDRYQMDKRYLCKDGRVIWGHLSVRLIDDANGRPLYCLPMLEDITERKDAETAFAHEAANAAMADLTSALISETSLQEISHLFLEYATRLTASPVGLIAYYDEEKGEVNALALELDDEGNASLLLTEYQEHARIISKWMNADNQVFLSNDLAKEAEFQDLDGLEPGLHRLILAPAILGESLIGLIGLANCSQPYTGDDVLLGERLAAVYAVAIHQLQLEEKYRFMSMHDALTGLYNRAYFEEELERSRGGRVFPISLIICDLDGLKKVNDNQGHSCGDDLLRRAAEVLRTSFRPEDLVARIGGDEFAIVLPHTDENVVKAALERIRKNIAIHNETPGQAPLSLSIGAATAEEGSALLEAFRFADEAMYIEKMLKKQRSALEAGS